MYDDDKKRVGHDATDFAAFGLPDPELRYINGSSIDKADRITNLNGFIRILASNIYRWENSSFNKNNKIVSNEIAFNDIYDDSDAITDEIYQQRMYALELYKLNAKPSQLRFIDLYFNKKIRTVEALKQELNISHRGAWTLIKDFKFKLKEYERKAELDET